MKDKITIKEKFERKPLGAINEKHPVPNGWFVLPFRLMPDLKDRRRYHGKWFMITSEHAKIYRVLRFAGGLKGVKNKNATNDVLLDWVGWIDLCGRDENTEIELELEISPVPVLRQLLAGFNHPEPSYKLSVILAFISAMLGIISIAITLIAL